MVPGSKGPRYLKVTFKYKLDSKEGPSCFIFKVFPLYIFKITISVPTCCIIYVVLFTLEPIKLAIGKEYNLNNLKEIQVTEDFLSLDKSVIGCQNEGSIDECKTREYIDALMSQCKCLPFSIRLSEEEVIN